MGITSEKETFRILVNGDIAKLNNLGVNIMKEGLDVKIVRLRQDIIKIVFPKMVTTKDASTRYFALDFIKEEAVNTGLKLTFHNRNMV